MMETCVHIIKYSMAGGQERVARIYLYYKPGSKLWRPEPANDEFSQYIYNKLVEYVRFKKWDDFTYYEDLDPEEEGIAGKSGEDLLKHYWSYIIVFHHAMCEYNLDISEYYFENDPMLKMGAEED